MPRPKRCRRVAHEPELSVYKPLGVPAMDLDEVVLSLDELESIRLADLEGLYQEAAAENMNISRATFGRILDSAHKKVADALISGKILKFEGGNITMTDKRQFKCSDCNHEWEAAYCRRQEGCPQCKSENIIRTDAQCGQGRGRGAQMGGRCRKRAGRGNSGGGGGGGGGRGSGRGKGMGQGS